MKGFGIYVQNDLLEPKHFKAIGQALWLYLWLLDKMTSITEESVGKILGGSPIKFSTIKKDLPMSPASYTRYIAALEKAGYITALRTPYGHVFTITKAKKIFKNKENNKKCDSVKKRITNVRTENNRCDENKEDNTEDNTITTSESNDSAKNKDMGFNKYGDDYEEGVVNDDDLTVVEEKKPQTKKYPNAPAIRKIFQEVLGKNPANWKQNKNQLLACENLYTERGLDKVKNALLFAQENKDNKFCPIIHSPHCLDSKWTKLGEFKLKQV